jgi:HEAT repeat protein
MRNDVNLLIEQLHKKEAKTRKAAAQALVKAGAEAVPSLLQCLTSADSGIQWLAAWALGEIRDQRAVIELQRTLKSPFFWVRKYAAEALGSLGSRESIPDLLILLNDESVDAQIGAIRALGKLREPSTIQPLLVVLGADSPKLRCEGIKALDEFRMPSLLDPLLVMFADTGWDPYSKSVADTAAKAVARYGSTVIPQLVVLSGDHNSRVRQSAATALGYIGSTDGTATLISLLQDMDTEVRIAAILGLGKVGDGSAVAALIPLLDDTRFDDAGTLVADIVAEALSRIGTPEAFAAVADWKPNYEVSDEN